MASALTEAVLDLVRQSGEHGIPMGALVDALEAGGHAAQDIEHEVWDLLSHRRLTPSGFVCRTVMRRPTKDAAPQPLRIYEFLLAPWSAEQDGQLELDIG